MIVEVIKWRTDLLFERAGAGGYFLVDQIVGLLRLGRCGALHTVRRAVLFASTIETVFDTVRTAPDAGSETFSDRRFTCCSCWMIGRRRRSWTIESGREKSRVRKMSQSSLVGQLVIIIADKLATRNVG